MNPRFEIPFRPRGALHLALAVALAAVAVTASADGGGGGAGGGDDPAAVASAEYTRAVAAIQAGRFGDAIPLLQTHLERRHDDADAHNWLAYAYRKSGHLDEAFVHYKRALALVPGHLGAHEYIGEAYLQVGQPEKAEYHLKELARLCASSCEQYLDLKQAIAQYRVGTPTAKDSKDTRAGG